jgi:predicted protein tyrosine phosphatase
MIPIRLNTSVFLEMVAHQIEVIEWYHKVLKQKLVLGLAIADSYQYETNLALLAFDCLKFRLRE